MYLDQAEQIRIPTYALESILRLILASRSDRQVPSRDRTGLNWHYTVCDGRAGRLGDFPCDAFGASQGLALILTPTRQLPSAFCRAFKAQPVEMRPEPLAKA